VVVDNGSSDAGTCAILDRLSKEGTKVIAIDEPFYWILRSLLDRPEVGAVVARLLYPDDTLRGILFGWHGSVIHVASTSLRPSQWTYETRRVISRAIPSKQAVEEVGGVWAVGMILSMRAFLEGSDAGIGPAVGRAVLLCRS
jgi:hypothetical protein